MGMLGEGQGEVDEGGGEGVEGRLLFGGVEGEDEGVESGCGDQGEEGWTLMGAGVLDADGARGWTEQGDGWERRGWFGFGVGVEDEVNAEDEAMTG